MPNAIPVSETPRLSAYNSGSLSTRRCEGDEIKERSYSTEADTRNAYKIEHETSTYKTI